MQTWVFAEEIEGAPTTLALEMLSKARTFGGDLAAVYLGAGSDAAFATLGAHGATKVFHLTPGGDLPTAAAAAALAGLVAEHQPDLLLFGVAFTDRDVAGRLSARLDRPVLANAVEITIAGDTVQVINEILGGTTLIDTAYRGPKPWIGIVRPKSFAAEAGAAFTPEVIPVALPDVGHAGEAALLEHHTEVSEGPSLEDAVIVVTAGRGVGGTEKMAPLSELAALLGAAVGGTRAVVDAGWLPFSAQVGQTGKTVRPSVYIAAGVSGAMQHLVGMKDSGTIIAVNKDEEAPIFRVADLGIVGDLHKVLPKLVEELKTRR
ncbi:MAG TPA: electron transfer flavoprotein subunit alpha/FixB family protein [Acidimicrobiia bacterium]|nr:electron transfer flavoprotein subunit alpha/FixB family protein [Acidimicrobiia bacterium]